jgi:tetratricopeptide (TPR) repeat protein
MHASAQSLLAQLRQNPLDSGALQALRKQAEREGDHASWAEALELHCRALADNDGDPVELGKLHFELGNLYRDQLKRQDRAIAHYRAAIDADAAQRPAIVAARGIYAQVGKWDQVAKLMVREADSLPEGAKRANVLQELARVYKTELHDAGSAARVLREAAGYVPSDLHVRHELATLLLEQADRESDSLRAEEMRREAADVLCTMAAAVSDDYAFAYIEAALDAVPDHERGLTLLETIAPRVGRTDTIPPRWVAGLQMSPEGPLSRGLRLKLAKAYESVGQLDDARACLEPLLSRGDLEAQRLAGMLGASQPTAGVAVEDELLEDDIVAEPSRVDQVASDIDALRDSTPEVADPLFDLARISLRRPDATLVDDMPTAENDLSDLVDEPTPSGHERPLLADLTLTGEELAANEDQRASFRPSRPPQGGDELLDSDTPVSGSEVIAASDSELIVVSDAVVTSQHSASAVQDLLRASADVSLAGGVPSFDEVPDDGDALDPHAEVTQPRAPNLEGVLAPEPSPSSPPAAARKPAVADAPVAFSVARPSALPAPMEAAPTTPHQPRPSRPAGELDATGPIKTDSGSPKRLGKPEPKLASEIGSVGQPIANDQVNLRKELEKRIRFRDRRGAAEIAEQMLNHDGTDAEAIAALEDHYRTTRDFKRMRELSMRIARETGLPLDTRITRLREAAMLSESKLGDLEGTLSAWKALLELLPQDEEGSNKLRKLYTRHGRWDDLAQLIERQVASETDGARRAALLREVGLVHRDKRKVLDDAIAAFTSARESELGRGDDSLARPAARFDDEVVLSELFVAAKRYAEAALMYEARLASTEEPVERIPLLRTLAELYESELGDPTRSLASTDALLAIAPRDGESLERLERIAERTDQPERRIDALTRKLAITEPAGQAALYTRIAEIAHEKLADAERAATAYREALLRAPANTQLHVAAEPVFEEAGRRAELTELFNTLAHTAREPSVRGQLLRKVAERERADGNYEAAIHAFEQLLIVSKDREGLTALVELLRKTERHAELAVRLDALANLSEGKAARDLRVERAQLFAEKLSRLDNAKAELEKVLAELSPDDVPVLSMLAGLAKQSHDLPLYAKSEERRMRLLDPGEAPVEVAEALVSVYEEQLKDDAGAIRVLEYWIGLAPGVPQPYLRVVPLYERTGRDAELLAALDALTTLAMAEDEAGEFLLRAARVAIKRGDYDGAWSRLVPRVVDVGDAQAEALLRELAQLAGRGKELAELYVGLAQRQNEVATEKQRWMDAAYTYETMVGAPDKGLEAMLRALAKDPGNPTLLDEADRLAAGAQAWPRLTQVYDALARRAESADARIHVLMRLASILEQRANDLRGAFERAALAFQLDPDREDTYTEARRLARAGERTEELLTLHERRAVGAGQPGARVDALLEACSVAQHVLADPPRATGYLARAVVGAAGDDALLAKIEDTVRELDEAQPPIDGRGLTYALGEVYKLRAEEEKREPRVAALLLRRAASLYTHDLDDLESAYRALERAATFAPGDDEVLDELVLAAERATRFDALADHFQRLADDAIDSTTASAALRRLGSLLHGPLGDPSRAAEVYKQLVMLRPRDTEAANALRACLKEAGRYKDLLIALDRELSIASGPEDKVRFLRESAETWEHGLANRFEAKDAWKKVLALAPQDADALAALERLSTRPSIDERSLLEGDVVVLPEDLRPSLPPEVPQPAPAVEVQAESSRESAVDEAQPQGEAGAPDEEGREAAASPEHVPHAEDTSWSEPPAPGDAGDGEPEPEALAAVAPGEAPVEDGAESAELGAREETPDGPATEASEARADEGSAAAPETDRPREAEGATAAEVASAEEAANLSATYRDDNDRAAPADSPFDDEPLESHESGLGGLTEPAPAMYGHAELEGEPELEPGEEGDLVTSSELSVDEVIAAEKSVRTSTPAGSGMDTDPSELAAADEPQPERRDAIPVPPSPPVPWAEADRPSQHPQARADLLAELESLDNDVLEGDEMELETSDEEDEDAKSPPAGLDALSSMVERSQQAAPPPRPRIPAPPPAPRPGGTVPPPIPRTAPPAPAQNGAHTPIPPPPPPRRN